MQPAGTSPPLVPPVLPSPSRRSNKLSRRERRARRSFREKLRHFRQLPRNAAANLSYRERLRSTASKTRLHVSSLKVNGIHAVRANAYNGAAAFHDAMAAREPQLAIS